MEKPIKLPTATFKAYAADLDNYIDFVHSRYNSLVTDYRKLFNTYKKLKSRIEELEKKLAEADEELEELEEENTRLKAAAEPSEREFKKNQKNGKFESVDGHTYEEKRAIALKMHLQGYSNVEIASCLNIAPDSVRSYIRREKKQYTEQALEYMKQHYSRSETVQMVMGNGEKGTAKRIN